MKNCLAKARAIVSYVSNLSNLIGHQQNLLRHYYRSAFATALPLLFAHWCSPLIAFLQTREVVSIQGYQSELQKIELVEQQAPLLLPERRAKRRTDHQFETWKERQEGFPKTQHFQNHMNIRLIALFIFILALFLTVPYYAVKAFRELMTILWKRFQKVGGKMNL